MNRCTINIVLGSGKCYEEKWDWEKESVVEGGVVCYFTKVKREDAEEDQLFYQS